MNRASAATDIWAPGRGSTLRPPGPAIASVQSAALSGWAAWLTLAWSAVGTMLYLLMPKGGPIVLVLSLFVPLLWLGSAVRYVRPFQPSGLNIALGLSAVYMLINASWSLAAHDAYRSALAFIIAMVALCIAVAVHRALHEQALRAMLHGLLAGYAVVGAVLFVGAIGEFTVLRWVLNAFPHWRPEIEAATLVGGNYTELPDHLFNRNAAALVLLLWPAVLAAIELADNRRTRALLLLALAPAVATILITHHATSKAALLGGAVMLALHYCAPRIGPRLLGTAWIVACVAVVPAAFGLYGAQLHTKEWLFGSARHRIVIWDYTAGKIAEAPILGAGINAARVLDKTEESTRTMAPGTIFPRETSVHAHNAYLQVWFETGAVGAALLLGIGLLVIRALARAPQRVQPLLFTTFATHALVAAFGYSIWAPWLLASFALAVVFASPTVALADRDPDAAQR